jgi:hypothetical protein
VLILVVAFRPAEKFTSPWLNADVAITDSATVVTIIFFMFVFCFFGLFLV